MNFGESLFEPGQLLFQLHNPNVCTDISNGFALMRMDALMADEAAKFETTAPLQPCYCSSEDEDSNEGESDSSYDGTFSTDEKNQDMEMNRESWAMGQKRKRGKTQIRSREEHVNASTISLEKPLVGRDDEDGAIPAGHDNSLPDNISITSLLNELAVGSPSPKILPPPLPPPRQPTLDTSVTHGSTGSVPIITDTSNQRRVSTISLRFNHGPSKESDDSTLSEDFNANFVG